MSNKKSVFILVFCYLFWGFQPLYWALNDSLDSYTILGCRIVMAAVFSVLILLCTGRLKELVNVFRNKNTMRYLLPAAIFLLADWGVFIVAVNSGHVLDVSLGYYVNPLLLFAAGVVIFKEKCSKAQIAALGIAFLGVVVSTAAFGSFPALALVIAVNWAVYVMLKKNIRIDGVVSIAAETLILTPIALAFLLIFRHNEMGALHGGEAFFLIGSGIVTALPMFLYSNSVCRFPLIVMCFAQYLSPTFNLICGILMGETFTPSRIVSLVFFVAAIALFTADEIRRLRKWKIR